MPRARPNSRIKDLPDIALLATTQPIDGTRLRAALEATFDDRGTHELPHSLPDPPAFWVQPYSAMAAMDDLAWTTLEELTRVTSSFFRVWTLKNLP